MHLDILKHKLTGTLPGIESQLKMAPEHRAKEIFAIKGTDFSPRLSAVLILLFHDADVLKIIFIRRSEYVGIHSGQIAFPGGRFDETDPDLKFTALREVEEEIGIKSDSIEILGHLSDLYIPPSNFLVRAYYGYLKERPVYKIDEREVQEVYEINFELFMQENIVKIKEFSAYNSSLITTAPYYDVNGIVIWGATAMILTEFLDLVRE